MPLKFCHISAESNQIPLSSDNYLLHIFCQQITKDRNGCRNHQNDGHGKGAAVIIVSVCQNCGRQVDLHHAGGEQAGQAVRCLNIEYFDKSCTSIEAGFGSLENGLLMRVIFKIVDVENNEFDEGPMNNVLACIVSTLQPKNIPRVVASGDALNSRSR
jgi:hypothetical protein